MPNGKILKYQYDVKTPIRIESMDPQERYVYSFIEISGFGYKDTHTFHGSNGLQVIHHFKNHDIHAQSQDKHSSFTATYKTPNYLSEVQSPLRENEKLVYANDLSLLHIDRKNNPVTFSYAFTKAFGNISHKRINEYLGKGSSQIEYSKESAVVHHSDGSKTEHQYNKQLLPTQEKLFDPNGNLSLEKEYQWDESNRLERVSLFDGTRQLLYCREFEYDQFGNPIKESLTGQINQATETHVTQRVFTEDGRNLLLEESDSTHKKVKYRYLDGTNLPLSKFTCEDDSILIREFWEYDDCHNLVNAIIDDGATEDNTELSGVTERRITSYSLRNEDPYLHMPEWIEERYFDGQSEQLLQKRHLIYDQYGNVSQEEFYDAEGCFAFTLLKEYDQAGNLLSETNALGQRAFYKYDENGNQLNALTFSGDIKTEWTYDEYSRLITEKKLGENCSPEMTEYEYDTNDLVVKKIVNGTNITEYKNDPIALKPFEITSPKIAGLTVKKGYQYNALGHEVSKTNANGHVTKIQSNLYGQPLKISYPDGTDEEFDYSIKGQVIRHVNQEGTVTEYKRDILGRTLSKTVYSSAGDLLTQETYTYSAFHLLSETDPEGNLTRYRYDGAGRKIREEKEGRVITYKYDSFGRLSSKASNTLIHHMNYDFLDRIVEESKTDLSGNLLRKTTYAYDKNGNRSAITHYRQNGPATNSYQYDALGRMIAFIDAEGASTYYHYDDQWINEQQQQVLKKTIVDPNGLRTEIIFDPYENPVTRQKIDLAGALIHQERKEYDPEGNCTLLEEIAMIQGEPIRVHRTAYDYDWMNRCEREIRAQGTLDERITEYAFTPSGQLAEKRKPDGETLYYSYNALGYLDNLTSSDGSINLSYRSNHLGQLIEACDHRQSITLARSLDHFGNVCEESWNNGLKIRKSFDEQNRILSLEFPEGSIQYTYDPVNLKSVTRLDQKGNRLYQHHYNEYDLSGSLLSETLIGDSGRVSYQRDSLGRHTSLKSPYFTQECVYDPVGNLVEATKDHKWTRYVYDPLSQLIQENEDHYEFDSLYNRTSKNGQFAHYNQLCEHKCFSYDRNGNLIQDDDWKYTYDALNRLVKVENQQKTITYTYDPIGRRISKDSNGEHEYYLYNGDQEIGSYNLKKELGQLFVPGRSWIKDSYIPVAIELRGRVYAPIVDAHGNIIKLIDSEAQSVSHHYRFSAFGEHLEADESIFNPWRFASRRFDPELNLIYFGQRYYSPCLGRWMSTDPEGSIDSTNLYQYAYNNPFRYYDPDGRFVFVIAVPLALSAISLEVVGTAAVAALTAAVIYESVPIIESWVNQAIDKGKYSWDDLGWNPEAPADYGFEWKGRGPPSSGKGNWVNGEEKLHPDFDHEPPIGPHWDYTPEKKHNGYRLHPDGRCEPKKKSKKSKDNT